MNFEEAIRELLKAQSDDALEGSFKVETTYPMVLRFLADYTPFRVRVDGNALTMIDEQGRPKS